MEDHVPKMMFPLQLETQRHTLLCDPVLNPLVPTDSSVCGGSTTTPVLQNTRRVQFAQLGHMILLSLNNQPAQHRTPE